MHKNDHQKLVQDIATFEAQQQNLSPSEAELALVAILTPLMAVDGYEVVYQKGARDIGLDFLAVSGQHKIGIEYKHYRDKVSSVTQVRELVGAAVLNKLDKIVLLTNTGFTKSAMEAASKIEPIAVELLDIEGLKSWVANVEADYNESEVMMVLRSFTQKIIDLIIKNPATLNEIEWRDLERVVAEVFSGIGFDVELTPASKDGGKDVILECVEKGTKKTFIIEIKHWRSGQRVGESKVREFVKVITKEKRAGGLFLSTYGFTENAVESLTEIDKQKVRFGEEAKIITLCKTYIKRKSGLWHGEQDLPTILFEGTV